VLAVVGPVAERWPVVGALLGWAVGWLVGSAAVSWRWWTRSLSGAHCRGAAGEKSAGLRAVGRDVVALPPKGDPLSEVPLWRGSSSWLVD